MRGVATFLFCFFLSFAGSVDLIMFLFTGPKFKVQGLCHRAVSVAIDDLPVCTCAHFHFFPPLQVII